MGSAPPIDDMIRMEKPHVVALEICAEAQGTNGAPPRARVRIVDVLHGALPLGERDAVFPADHQMRFYAIRNGGDEGLARWNAEPCGTPATGERLIAAGTLEADGALSVWTRSVRPDAESERARLRALLEEAT